MSWNFKNILRHAARLSTTLLLLLGSEKVRAQAIDEVEAKVKSAFLLNFARYVEWPDTNSANPIVIGVLGVDPFGRHLDSTVEGKTVERRPVHLKRSQNVSDLADCHVIFISASERTRLATILAHIGDKRILTVSDMDGFTAGGGMIQLKKKQNTMRFDINREAAEKVHLKISSKLLKLADNPQ
jgi:hypothetical protein